MKDSGEDSDSIDPPSSKNISFPPPLNLVTPEQALEILLLLSQNRNVADYINFDRGPVVPGNDDLLKDTSQSGPELGRKESRESVDNPSDHSVPAAQFPMVEAAADPERSLTVREANTRRDETRERGNETSSSQHQLTTVTDELCENKFEELKQLLSDARRAANDIVHSQERSRLSDAGIVENADDKTEKARLEEETKGRAGKYNKRPAPRAPLAGDEEEDGRSALKATLVIKTGTLKSFSNAGTAKDVFVARSSKGSRSRRTRENGFSKLFAIPRNVFHTAFHRGKEKGGGDSCCDAAEAGSSSVETMIQVARAEETNVENSSNAATDDESRVDETAGSVETRLADEEKVENVETMREEIGKRLESDIF